MQNEIEVKIMLRAASIPAVQDWLNLQNPLAHEQLTLGNTYFDTPEQFFAREQMGLRVRSVNQRHELTLKMKGEIIGGLHSRPEYNLDLPNNTPDFKRLVSHFNLQIADAESIAEQLVATFRTDFQRETWQITFQQSEIEIALDQGIIENPLGKEEICELEFELKQGEINDLFDFIDLLPKSDGMWLSSLSKAQRGYLVGRAEKIAKEIEKLTACEPDNQSERELYQYEQQIADLLRLQPDNTALLRQFARFNPEPIDLFGADYLCRNLAKLRSFSQ